MLDRDAWTVAGWITFARGERRSGCQRGILGGTSPHRTQRSFADVAKPRRPVQPGNHAQSHGFPSNNISITPSHPPIHHHHLHVVDIAAAQNHPRGAAHFPVIAHFRWPMIASAVSVQRQHGNRIFVLRQHQPPAQTASRPLLRAISSRFSAIASPKKNPPSPSKRLHSSDVAVAARR